MGGRRAGDCRTRGVGDWRSSSLAWALLVLKFRILRVGCQVLRVNCLTLAVQRLDGVCARVLGLFPRHFKVRLKSVVGLLGARV